VKKLTDILKSKYPIICGPMAWTSMAPLVGAVTNAGGFGVLGVGFAPNDVVEKQIEETRALTTGEFAINVTLSRAADENIERITEIAEENQIRYIYADNFEGLDRDFTKKWFDRWHAKGIVVLTKVATVQEAVIADACAADVIIAKGREGGGHMTLEGTLPLVPQVVDVTKHAVVVASGGIADGRGFAAAIALGAVGVEMGTVFMAAKEGGVHENVKQAVIQAVDGTVVTTGASTGGPCWQLQNKLSDKLNQIERENKLSVAAPLVAKEATSSLRIASVEGEIKEKGAVMAGQVVPMVTAIRPVKDILEGVYQDGKQVIQNLQAVTI